MTVTVLASSECVDIFRARIVVEGIPDQPVYLEAALMTKKSPTAKYHVMEEVSVFAPTTQGIEIAFKKEIRQIGFWSVLTMVVRPCQPDSTAQDLIARFTLPVFNPAGLLLSGKYVVLGDILNATAETLDSTNSYAFSQMVDSDAKSKVNNILENYRRVEDKESLLGELRSFWSHAYAQIQVNPSLDQPILFASESSKSSIGRQISSDFFRDISPPLVTQPSEDSVLTNWMVINGPVDSRGPAAVSGTGYVHDLQSSMAPNPIQIVDYELFKEHPAATKASRIQRFSSGILNMTSSPRPNADEMSLLNDIILQPMRDLSVSERELLLKFMWSLSTKKQALLKVLLVAVEAVEGMAQSLDDLVNRILSAWTPVDVDGALALLGEEIGNLNAKISILVRKYAVNRLAAIASSGEILLFLFQLVQSLRYDSEQDPTVSGFLIGRASKDEELATMLFWLLQCKAPGYDHVSQQLWVALSRSEVGRKIREGLELQCQFRERLLDIAAVLRNPPRSMEGASKSDILREAIRGVVTASMPSSVIGRINLSNKLNFPVVGAELLEIPIPVDSNLALVRVDETKSFCIKSAKAPFVVSCEVSHKKTRHVEVKRYMFKTGDDLRQDQLIIQLISLFDGLFKSYGLDLKLTPYKVLATSTDDGFVEFVGESSTLSSILANHNNDLLAYFRSVKPKADAPHGIDPVVLDTFSRSCAGYCAITYVLGIGDRHMDNLMVTTDGRLFHVDFGYILGRDPKPFPPPMKLCREMVDGMGGTSSVHYRSFVSKCTQAFLIIRRHASLLVSLLYLAAEANLKDMREQDPTLAILKVQKRLMPEVSDEIAEQQMVNLINESTNALFPVVMEKLHKWAIYWRN